MEALSSMSTDLAFGIAAPFLLPLCVFPPLQLKARSFCNPLVTRRVADTLDIVERVQAFRQPGLLTIFSVCNASVSTEFYVVLLAVLTWTGNIQTAALVGYLLCLALYFGNAVKDMVGAPRPFMIATSTTRDTVKLQGSGESNNAAEHGLPSTHVINTLVLGMYAVHLWGNGSGEPYAAGRQMQAYAVCVVWTMWIGWGRIYCGMHSLVDVTSGLFIGFTIYCCFIWCEDALLDVLQAGYNGLGKQFLMLLLLLAVYPRPRCHTPSYGTAITIMGGVFGLMLGYQCLGDVYPGIVSAGEFAGFSWTSNQAISFKNAALRIPLGLLIMITFKAAAKLTLQPVVSSVICVLPKGVRRVWHPSLGKSNSRLETNSNRIESDVANTTRFLSYALLGMCCSCMCTIVFYFLNI